MEKVKKRQKLKVAKCQMPRNGGREKSSVWIWRREEVHAIGGGGGVPSPDGGRNQMGKATWSKNKCQAHEIGISNCQDLVVYHDCQNGSVAATRGSNITKTSRPLVNLIDSPSVSIKKYLKTDKSYDYRDLKNIQRDCCIPTLALQPLRNELSRYTVLFNILLLN